MKIKIEIASAALQSTGTGRACQAPVVADGGLMFGAHVKARAKPVISLVKA
jgi:hypothetical protein